MYPKKEPLTPRDNPPKQKIDKVQVILRVRPFLETEDPDCFISPQPNHSISINKPGMTSFMKFNHVQHESNHVEKGHSQKEMFSSVEEAVKCIFEGHDSTIFAYGQTGAGKTYSIIGNCPENNSDDDFYKTTLCSLERGILPRSLELIFQEQRRKKNSRITISFFEIYNQKIFDLLTGDLKSLDLRQSKTGEITIVGLSAIEVISMKEAISFLAGGVKNRSTSSTSVNIKSSRSHSIFHLKYEQLVVNPETKQHDVVVSHLRVVDLAGSEKFNISSDLPQAEKDLRLLELKSINGSLSKLGHCISALTIQSRTHIPVRDSKLTRILSESLLGSGRIRLIICISPSFSSMNETSSTLQFADRVKKAIFERPTTPNTEKKRHVDFDEFTSLQEQLEQERQKREELERIVAMMSANPGELNLVRENEKLKKEIHSLKEQLRIYTNQDKLSESRRNHRPSPLPYANKSLSPKPISNQRSNIPVKVALSTQGGKPKSTPPLKQDNSTLGKVTGTPPKKAGPKSTKDFESKSQRMSVDDPQRTKQISKFRKEGAFDNKVKMFMDKPEYDGQLEEKVKKKLLEIKKEISMGSREWLENEDLTEESLWK